VCGIASEDTTKKEGAARFRCRPFLLASDAVPYFMPAM
jgi:hypothetical protein